MNTISGKLLFDKKREANINLVLSGIPNVAIVLQNIDTLKTLAVLTKDNGEFMFNNVPNGNYQLVESYGYMPTTTSPGDFANAISSILLNGGKTPPISFVNDPPSDATNLDCTIPNTLPLIVSGLDITTNFFLNGPVTYTPITFIMDESVVVSTDNLIKNVDNGTFGQYPAGHIANFGETPNPYPSLVSDFIYTVPTQGSYRPSDGQYTIQNIITSYKAWWIIPDHTYGNEQGRMMVINGNNPDSIIFEETVTVKPQTYYLFSSWILNIVNDIKQALPALGVAVLNTNGDYIYYETLDNLIPVRTESPEWKQIGTVIYSGDITSLTFQFISMGPSAIGNDYVIDDIMLNEVTISSYIPIKTADKTDVYIGDTITYTITLEKKDKESLTNVFVKDVLPDGLTFVLNSVIINGESKPGLDPNDGFTVPDILGGTTLIVSFKAIIDSVPTSSPFYNKAHLTYSYSPVEGGISNVIEVDTNEVPINIMSADLSIEKIALSPTARPNEQINYSLIIKNLGPSNANDIIITDNIPNNLSYAQFSVDNGITWKNWNGTYNIDSLQYNTTLVILIKAIVNYGATGVIVNTSTINSSTPDPNLENNKSITNTTVISPLQDLYADLEITKTAFPNPLIAGELVTFTLTIKNNGPDDATDVTLIDTISSNITNQQFSIDNGQTWSSWNGSYDFATLANQETITVLINGIVSTLEIGTISNTATIISTIPDSNHENNTSFIEIPILANADLSVLKSASRTEIQSGELITYIISVINNGPADAHNVIIADNVPNDLNNVEYSIDNVAWFSWNGFYIIDTLENEETFILTIRGILRETTSLTLRNHTVIRSSNPDPDTSNNEDEIITEIGGLCNLSIIKNVNLSNAYPCQLLAYKITISNAGPYTAKNVFLTDIISDKLYDCMYSIDNGSTWKNWIGFLQLGDLTNNSSIDVIIRGTVDECAYGKIINTATVTTITRNINIENNHSTATTNIICCN